MLAPIALAAALALAQTSDPFGRRPRSPATLPAPRPPAPPPSPVIARVGGRAITQADFDRLAGPYFERLRAQLKDAFNDETRRIASRNVLEELVRRDVLAIEAQTRKIPVTEDDTDRILRLDPSFTVNGRFDPAKLMQFKLSPGSNYPAILPRLREFAAASKLDSMTRARLKPTPAAVRAEWEQRARQVRFQFFAIGLRDVSLDPEATEIEQAAFYAAHPELFTRRARARLRYVALPLPAAGDSARAGAETAAIARGRDLGDSLRAGVPLDTIAAPLGGALDTGPFDLPPGQIPGLGRIPALVTALAHADSDTSVRVVGPAVVRDQVVLGLVTGREPRRLPPLREVQGDVKRRADQEKRRAALEADRQAYYAAHPDSFRTTGRAVIRAVVSESDSILLAGKIRALAGLAAPWRAGRDLGALMRTVGARVESLSLTSGTPDTLFPGPLVDSLIAGTTAPRGSIEGPRRFGSRAALWRADAPDSAFVPPIEAVRARVEALVQQEKRVKDEAEGRAWYEAHREGYRTKPKFVVDYVTVKVPAADSVAVPEASLRKYYDSHRDRYRQEEQVRARHILIGTRPGQAPEAEARARADSLLGAIRAGADFAELARRFSQDRGSAEAGGDLGFFPRGRMVPEFNDTAFALGVGRVSELVKTQFGYHIIKVDEHRAAGMRPFDEVRAAIHTELGQTIGDSTTRLAANALRRRLAPGTDAARAAATTAGIRTSAPFAADEPAAELGFVQGLPPDLPALPLGRWAPKVYRSASAWVLVRPAKHVPETQAEFDEVKRQAVEDAKNTKRRELLAQKIAAVRAALAASAPLDSLAAPYGGLKESGPLTRGGMVPGLGNEPRMIAGAFEMDSNQVSDTLTTATGVAWVRAQGQSVVAGAAFAQDAPAIEQELLARKYGEWLDRRAQAIGVRILRADLRPEAPPPIAAPATVAPRSPRR